MLNVQFSGLLVSCRMSGEWITIHIKKSDGAQRPTTLQLHVTSSIHRMALRGLWDDEVRNSVLVTGTAVLVTKSIKIEDKWVDTYCARLLYMETHVLEKKSGKAPAPTTTKAPDSAPSLEEAEF